MVTDGKKGNIGLWYFNGILNLINETCSRKQWGIRYHIPEQVGGKPALQPSNVASPLMEAMFPSCHLCKPGAESCCQDAADHAAEVIHSEGLKAERPEKAIPRILGDGQDNPDDRGTDEGVLETSFSGHSPLQEQPSEVTPQEGAPSVGWKKMIDMSHMEIDYEITRGIPLHRALRHSELWTSPHEVRCRNRAADVWKLSTKVSTLDIFISHTWKTKGRWKVLALVIQTGWLHGLLGWSLGLVVMLLLRALDIVDDPWDNVPIELAGKPFRISVTLWTVISAELSMIVGLCLAPYLPFKTKHCFLDIACIHQEQRELFERGCWIPQSKSWREAGFCTVVHWAVHSVLFIDRVVFCTLL